MSTDSTRGPYCKCSGGSRRAVCVHQRDGQRNRYARRHQEPDIRAFRFLQAEGYRVLTAQDGDEAVAVHLKHKDAIALVVLDLGLPKLNGWEAFRKMKTSDPAVKAIFATGYISSQIDSGVAKGELSALIMKPYQLDEVLAKIAEAIHAPARCRGMGETVPAPEP
ncbi:MAG: response regulator [Candidatus Binatia bacterium]